MCGLRIYTAKTNAMIFEKGRHTTRDLFLYNILLEVVNSFKYLGIHFFNNGNWFRTQKRLAQNASFLLHYVFSLFKQIDIPVSGKCKLFEALVGSTLNYCSEIWGMHHAKYIEMVHT